MLIVITWGIDCDVCQFDVWVAQLESSTAVCLVCLRGTDFQISVWLCCECCVNSFVVSLLPVVGGSVYSALNNA